MGADTWLTPKNKPKISHAIRYLFSQPSECNKSVHIPPICPQLRILTHITSQPETLHLSSFPINPPRSRMFTLPWTCQRFVFCRWYLLMKRGAHTPAWRPAPVALAWLWITSRCAHAACFRIQISNSVWQMTFWFPSLENLSGVSKSAECEWAIPFLMGIWRISHCDWRRSSGRDSRLPYPIVPSSDLCELSLSAQVLSKTISSLQGDSPWLSYGMGFLQFI